MIEPVERKIQEINLKKKKALKKQRDSNLVRWGFDGKKRAKNDIPLILTEEEYDAVLAAEKEYTGSVKTDKNALANFLFILGIAVIVIGVVAGVVLYQMAADIGFIYFTISIIGCALLSVVFFSLSEIIKMLQQIIDRG